MKMENEIASSYLPTYTYLPKVPILLSYESQVSKEASKHVSTNKSINQSILS